MMNNIGLYSIGKHSIGLYSLGGAVSTSSSKSKELYKQLLAKMKKEQPQLAESLVCWYSPNLQGMTNKQLYDAMLVGEYPILRDLSGNGYDMKLHGFDGTSASGVDGDGNLIFDGVNDYGMTEEASFLLTDFTVFWEATKPNSIKCPQFLKGSKDASAFNETVIAINRLGYEAAVFGAYTNIGESRNSGSVVMTPQRYNSITITNRGTVTDKDFYVYTMAKYGKTTFTTMIFRCAVVFDHTLTDSEIDWVKTNMFVSQEPKKYVVNLWYYNNGEPILLGTQKVNNGAEIGELPSFDIDSTTCTNEWYYDLTLSEDALVYDDDYVESDLNLYCSTMPIYQRMLDELDEVLLEDGTTAREHLICFYNPKLQGLTKESVLSDATLADLSGNGHDMTLYGFTKDEEIINDKGALVFDGVNDYAESSETPILKDFQIFLDIYNNKPHDDMYVFSKDNTTWSSCVFMVQSPWKANNPISWIAFGDNRLDVIKRITDHRAIYILSPTVVYLNNTRYTADYNKKYIDEQNRKLVLGKTRINNNKYVPYEVANVILFRITLTDDQINEVKRIFKLN